MKPIILKMQAFGPYADRAQVDFRRAIASGLFGIYGATGAGKSSIFNAMTFALFGEAAKDEQPAQTLRSDHAEPNLLTQVELVFEVAGRRYRVVRRPEQVRPAKRGGGETDEKHTAWLFDVTDLDPDAIGDANPGRLIAEKKVSHVNAAIIGILGYEAAQFRQIVLLPQGRFETFLNAKTDTRVDILRDLFDVSIYQELTERLRTRAKEARDDISRRREVNAGRLASETFETLDQLLDGIATSQHTCEDLAKAKADAQAALQQADAAYQHAAQTDQRFAEHAEAERHLQSVDAHREAHDADRTRLKFARAAAALAPKADAAARSERYIKSAQKACDEAADRFQQAAAEAENSANRLQALDAQADTIEAQRERRRQLEGFSALLARTEAMRHVHRDIEHAAAQSQRAFSAAEEHHAACLARHAQRLAEREDARQAQVQRGDLKLEAQAIGSRLKAAQDFENAQGALARSREHHARAFGEHEKAMRAHDARRTEFASIEAALLDSHALHLAAHLEPGTPCPVCGSPDHPAPASGTATDAGLTSRYRQAKEALEGAQAAAEKAATALTEAETVVRQREEALSGLTLPDGPAADIEVLAQTLRGKLHALGPQRDIGELDMQVAQAAEDLTAAQAALEAARNDRDSTRLDANRAETEVNSALATIPEELRAAGQLSAAMDSVRARLAAHEQDRQDAVQKQRKADTALASAKTAWDLAQREIETAAANQTEALATFEAARLTAGLTQSAFEAARADIESIDAIEDRIRAFGERLAAAQDRLARAELAIADTDRPDIAALKAARDEAEARQKQLYDDAAHAMARLEHLTKLHRDLKEEWDALDRLETETGPLRDLAETLSGENDARMTLETFAIATMFEHVLSAANLRLEPMTRGRYRLLRGTEGAGRSRRGLDIEVEDSFTGRTRPTSTLSGGETFIAALALALGLSDVVESTSGRVRLDTIFIDEGFGSLDSADDAGTLDQVLQSLVELVGNRRAVGLISHVPLVQQTVPNGFWVSSSASGSHIEERL